MTWVSCPLCYLIPETSAKFYWGFLCKMSEELFSSLSSTMSSVVQSIDLEQERLTSRPNAVGPLFNSSSPERTSRSTTRNAGAKPTRTFVWLGQNVTNVDLSSLNGKRVKFSKGMSSDAILTLLKREIPQIGSTR